MGGAAGHWPRPRGSGWPPACLPDLPTAVITGLYHHGDPAPVSVTSAFSFQVLAAPGTALLFEVGVPGRLCLVTRTAAPSLFFCVNC